MIYVRFDHGGSNYKTYRCILYILWRSFATKGKTYYTADADLRK